MINTTILMLLILIVMTTILIYFMHEFYLINKTINEIHKLKMESIELRKLKEIIENGSNNSEYK